MSLLKIGILGATGKMGQTLLQSAQTFPNIVAKGFSHSDPSYCSLEKEDDLRDIDVLIDFTHPSCFEKNLKIGMTHHKPMVIGTTGLLSDHFNMLTQASSLIPIVYSENMSLGITLMAKVVEHWSKILLDYDIECSEIHHRMKIDAPSGTALLLGRAAAKGRDTSLESVACFNRQGIKGPRPKGEIGFSVQRGGAYPGEHTVKFISEEECLELTHRSFSRTLFAKGALYAALWLKDQKPGLYSMADVLGL
ncbi:MAG: 4-hydroxy-tetrahydrodipicolinate reductase [Proteobacteria bacterium]|nr:4-hydroxy-tetrahydrodipicolinate reductase [Pseudomonadota bacterium]